MEQTPDAIFDFAAALAKKTFEDDKRPYYLADLALDLKKEGINYRDVLGGQRLKSFIEGAPDKIKLIQHPTQKSKIGLIPTDKTYVWSHIDVAPQTTSAATSEAEPSIAGSKRRYIVSTFLRLVSELPENEAAQVQIPTHILTKLMRDR